MSETVNFIQGSKRNYDSSTMQGGVYFSKDSTLKKKILWNGTAWVNMDGINLDTPINEWTTIE